MKTMEKTIERYVLCSSCGNENSIPSFFTKFEEAREEMISQVKQLKCSNGEIGNDYARLYDINMTHDDGMWDIFKCSITL